MRAVSQLLFLIFYVASSCVTTHERVSLVVQEVRHSTSRDHEQQQFDDSCKQLRKGYPHYREAKNVNADKYVKPAAVVDFALPVRIGSFLPEIASRHIDVAVETAFPRAPPVL